MEAPAASRRPGAPPPGGAAQGVLESPEHPHVGAHRVIPLFIWVAYQAGPLASLWAGALFAVAAMTDVVDGWLARRW